MQHDIKCFFDGTKYNQYTYPEKGGDGMKPKIISQIKINGEWINQEDIPAEVVQRIVERTIKRAAENIGYIAARKEKSA